MTSTSTCTGLTGKAILALLLVSVVLSGIPMVEVHSHENAEFGHSHDAHDFFDDHDVGDAPDEDGATDNASFHAHDINATSIGVVANISADPAVPQHSHSYIPPPYSWLPDNVLAPLYRPPIA